MQVQQIDSGPTARVKFHQPTKEQGLERRQLCHPWSCLNGPQKIKTWHFPFCPIRTVFRLQLTWQWRKNGRWSIFPTWFSIPSLLKVWALDQVSCELVRKVEPGPPFESGPHVAGCFSKPAKWALDTCLSQQQTLLLDPQGNKYAWSCPSEKTGRLETELWGALTLYSLKLHNWNLIIRQTHSDGHSMK